jgi:hypothetical protein
MESIRKYNTNDAVLSPNGIECQINCLQIIKFGRSDIVPIFFLTKNKLMHKFTPLTMENTAAIWITPYPSNRVMPLNSKSKHRSTIHIKASSLNCSWAISTALKRSLKDLNTIEGIKK